MERKGLRGVVPGARCDHDYPIAVHVYDGGRRARCLRCLAVGPVRSDPDGARRALVEERAKGSGSRKEQWTEREYRDLVAEGFEPSGEDDLWSKDGVYWFGRRAALQKALRKPGEEDGVHLFDPT